MQITVRLFGSLRKYSDGNRVLLEVPVDATVATLRRALVDNLKTLHPDFADEPLIEDSAWATEVGLLDASATLTDGLSVAILPPVCGG